MTTITMATDTSVPRRQSGLYVVGDLPPEPATVDNPEISLVESIKGLTRSCRHWSHSYRQNILVYVKADWQPRWGDLPVGGLTIDLYKEYLDDLYSLVEAGEIMLSTARVRRDLLNAMLERLSELGHISPPFWRHHTLPKLSTRGPDRVLDSAQLRSFIAAAPQRYRGMVEFLVWSLTRIGEACGLRWADVADDGHLATVRRQIIRDPTDGRLLQTKRLKTEAACRTIDIGPAGALALRRHRADWAPNSSPGDHVFTSGRGNPIDPSTLRRWVFRTTAERAGLTPDVIGFAVTPHVLRASGATAALAGGAEVARVAMMLGHKGLHVVMRYQRLAKSDRFSDVTAAIARNIG